MAEQRQPFRFRLPWQSAPAAPPPPPPSSESQPPGPKIETQTPAQSSTASIQRPPFRPAGIASAVLPPTASQASPTVASKPRSAPQTRGDAPSPSRAAPQTGASGSVPSSPSRTSQAQPASGTTSPPISRLSSPPSDRRTSQPSSPSRPTAQVQPTGTTKLQPIQESSQPSEKEPKPVVSPLSSPPADRRTSRPSSPSRPAAQVQPDVTTKLKPTIQESSQPLAVATQPPSSLSEKEPTSVVSLPLSQEPQLKAQVPSETISNSQNRTPIKTSSKLDGVTTRPTEVSHTSPTQKLNSNAIGGDAKPKLEEREVGKEVVREIIEEKTNGSSYEDPTKKTITAAFQENQKPKWEKEESFDRKEAVAAATSSIPKQINIASSRHPKERRSSSTLTTQKPSVISNGKQLPLHEEVRKDISKYVEKLTTSQSDYKKPVSVITLSGENRGASMQLGLESTKTDEFVPIHRGYKLNSDESTEATTDGEGSSTDKRSRHPTTKENPPSMAYVNSNVQSVNNSILFDTSVTENNPGVRLVVSKQKEPIKSNGKLGPLETHKAEFNVTPAEKLTYQPTVRRRCLRGLFLEPSDSEPDNPEKPRRHGCRFNCGGKDKEKEIGVL